MSNDALAWVWKHSPLKGVGLTIHLSIADSVTDLHQDEFWMRQTALAKKARTSRQTVNTTLADLIERGLLVLLEEHPGGANRYRLLMPDAPIVFDKTVGWRKDPAPPKKRRRRTGGGAVPDGDYATGGVVPADTPLFGEGVVSGDTGCHEGRQGVSSTTTGGVVRGDTEDQEEPKEIPSGSQLAAAEAAGPDDAVKRRARQLAMLAYEQDRKPVTRGGFIAVMARIEDALRAGRSVNELTAAIEACAIEVWTLDGISTALAKRKGSDRPTRNLERLHRAVERGRRSDP